MTVPFTGDLAGITVALLRNPERGSEMAAELRRRGAETLLVPMIDWELPEDHRELDRRLEAASTYDWILLTSVTTVRVLAQWAGKAGKSLSELVGAASIAAVGTATAEALQQADAPATVVPLQDQSAEGLLAVLPDGTARALLPQSDLAADTLRAGLVRRGWSVDTVTAYVTVDYPADAGRRIGSPNDVGATTRAELGAALQAGRIDAVVLTSPSTAERLHAMIGALPAEVASVAIGRRTERDAETLGLRIDAVAARPDPVGIADAVHRAVVNQRKRT